MEKNLPYSRLPFPSLFYDTCIKWLVHLAFPRLTSHVLILKVHSTSPSAQFSFPYSILSFGPQIPLQEPSRMQISVIKSISQATETTEGDWINKTHPLQENVKRQIQVLLLSSAYSFMETFHWNYSSILRKEWGTGMGHWSVFWRLLLSKLEMNCSLLAATLLNYFRIPNWSWQ